MGVYNLIPTLGTKSYYEYTHYFESSNEEDSEYLMEVDKTLRSLVDSNNLNDDENSKKSINCKTLKK